MHGRAKFIAECNTLDPNIGTSKDQLIRRSLHREGRQARLEDGRAKLKTDNIVTYIPSSVDVIQLPTLWKYVSASAREHQKTPHVLARHIHLKRAAALRDLSNNTPTVSHIKGHQMTNLRCDG